MTDIHCHILPGLDDGAADQDEALLMARIAFQSGTNTMVATPHAGLTAWPDAPDVIRGAAAHLQEMARAEGIGLTVLPGMELLCTHRLEQILDSGAFLTLAGSRYLLVEFFFDEKISAIRSMLRCVADRGLVPVIAHPERYEALQLQPELAGEWMERGYAMQINAGSLLGTLGPDAKRVGRWMVQNGLAHVVASDGHGMDGRLPQLHRVREYLEDRVSVACADALLYENPGLILRDAPLPRYR